MKTMWFFLKQIITKLRNNKLLAALSIAAIILLLIILKQIIYPSKNFDPSSLISLVLIFLLVLALCGFLVGKQTILSSMLISARSKHKNIKSLQKRIVTAFVITAAIPTVIITVFSVYFFNMGLQGWFDKKITNILEQSVIVAESYVNEHKIQMRSTALSIADDLSQMYYDIIHDNGYFNNIIEGQVEMRRLSEAIVFRGKTKTVLAQSALSFSLSFSSISEVDLEKAALGHIVEIKSDPKKIRVLIKLSKFDDAYLLIGRLVDKKTVEHIDKTNGAAYKYFRLKAKIENMQVKFFIIFILLVFMLLLFSIGWGIFFTRQIIEPVERLVDATDKVAGGDLSVRLPENNLNKDEILILTKGFNLMIKKLSRQQYDLMIAGRAKVWSDVARKVAHEIKNPLTPITLSLERISSKFAEQVKDKEEFLKYIDMIKKHTAIIRDIVAEFVKFARLPTPKFDTADIVEILKSNIRSRILQKNNIEYKLECSEQQMDFVCDATQINQVVINLLKNSESSIQKRKETENEEFAGIISLKLVKKQKNIIITFSDNGTGFSKDIIQRATEAYISDSKGGMGLGLAIVKKIVQDHFGNLQIKNKSKDEGGGAEIALTFEQNHAVT